MTTQPIDKIEILKQFVIDKTELEEQLKQQQEQLAIAKMNRQKDPATEKQITELKFKIKDTQHKLKHASKQVKWFATDIGGTGAVRTPLLVLVSLSMLVLGILLGYFVLPEISWPGSGNGSSVNQLIMCTEVFNGIPRGTGKTFEIARPKKLTCYTRLASRASQVGSYLEWYHKNIEKGVTALQVPEQGGAVWGEKEFTLADLGEWEVRLKTQSGNVLSRTKFNLVYPRINVSQALICENVVDGRPVNPATRFRARELTLYCYTETVSQEKYLEIVHEWYFNNQKVKQQPIQLEHQQAKTFSQFNVKATELGSWSVKIIDGQGTELKRLNFNIENQQIEVTRVEMARNQLNGKPDSLIQTFIADGGQLFCFTPTKSNFPNFKIKHQWIFDQKTVWEDVFEVTSTDTNIFSAKKINPNQAGTWTVRVSDAAGKILANQEIEVQKPLVYYVGITQLVVCRTVFEMDPYDIATRFKLTTSTKIWAHGTVRNTMDRETSVTYKWFHGKNLIFTSAPITRISKSNSFRTYAYITISPHQKGQWTVKVYGEDNSFLKETNFIIE